MGRGVLKKQKLKFAIASYKEFTYSASKRGKVVAKEFIEGLCRSTFSLDKTINPPIIPTTKAYPEGQVIINEKKIRDLAKLQ
ncbi:hypothetical protein PR048_021554 [Dryococelus australis]|uniref:Ribosomal protein S16 n=1 Tax=Dryococelus australis TaxID=614101 RepID=A0ABQ9GYM6_9NEOP|nr:hypothetical protein PR048_021554 [Dryococelus australis]